MSRNSFSQFISNTENTQVDQYIEGIVYVLEKKLLGNSENLIFLVFCASVGDDLFFLIILWQSFFPGSCSKESIEQLRENLEAFLLGVVYLGKFADPILVVPQSVVHIYKI